MSDIALFQKETAVELANPEVLKTLVATVFKNVSPALVPQAIVEGRIRGFTFKDFLEKNIYAVPFSGTYSLVTSIDWARKIGMRSGVIGENEPVYTESETDGKVLSCSVTEKRRIGQDIGEFTAKVFFSEYTTGKNLWATKPKTMIAKVAEMHALRKACPEELSQAYVEEEMEKTAKQELKVVMSDEQMIEHSANLRCATTLEELQKTWANLPPEAKNALLSVKDDMKKKLSTPDANTKV